MVFGKSKEDTSQDQQLKELWKWIEGLHKNQSILIKNNDYFIQRDKQNTTTLQQLTKAINALIEKDKQHDTKDAEHDTLIKSIKDMAKAVETATTEGP